ncbi:MAG TPA: hypothetical protein VNZ01_06200 [Solirubrobacteraceae bacterium]|jgi:hypothetical protein|nr:hypothetical protein [Solirubrobacteraceae bacterium]
MLARLQISSPATRALAAIAAVAALGGCGKGASSPSNGSNATTAAVAGAPATHRTCPETVLDVLQRVARRIYHQGVSSERTRSAAHLIAASAGLREAVERSDPVAARAAAKALVSGGHMTNLRVMRGGRVLADVGGSAVAPLHGTLTGAGGRTIGSYVTSVWADEGLIAETNGVTGGRLALRVQGRSVGGSLALPSGSLPREGTLGLGPQRYGYTSFHGEAYPSGSLRVYLLRPIRATAALCGSTAEDTVVRTLSRIANLIYAGEAGGRTLAQIQRVQRDPALLRAVAARDPLATKAAIESLLTEHIVRLRVSAGGSLLADVGGPFVLAPVTAPLRLAGRTIGSFVLSIQDDEGYLRLTRRLVGLRVLMYMNPAHPQLVKNSLGPSPGSVPASGSYKYRGSSFRVFTVNARAFPSGPLTIRVLVPVPYS